MSSILPPPTEPLIDKDGKIAEVWYRLLWQFSNAYNSTADSLTTLSALSFAYLNQQTFTSTAGGTWSKPAHGTIARIQCWGAGGSGGCRATTGSASGGGGGAYAELWIALSSLGNTESVTIGAGGPATASSNASGTAGGNTSFGSWLTAYAGGAGFHNAVTNSVFGGAGGTFNAKGADGSGTAGSVTGMIGPIYGIGATTTNPSVPDGLYSAGGSGITTGNAGATGGNSVWGGAGGGGTCSTGPVNSTGGTSTMGGAGGNGDGTTPTAGTQPGGGGGAGRNGQASGKGGDGKCIVTVW